MELKSLAAKIFSIKKDRKFIVLCIFGVKLSLRQIGYYRKRIAQRLLKPAIPDCKENTFLVLEANLGHGECVPGFVSYFLDLGYNADVILQTEIYLQKPMCRVKRDNIRCFTLTTKRMGEFLAAGDKMSRYKGIFITSHIVYPEKDRAEGTVFDVFPALWNYRDKIIVAEHHLELADDELLRDDRVVTLAEFPNRHGRRIRVNPHRYGSITKLPKNNGRAVFIIIGAIHSSRRNYNILLDALKKLVKTEKGRFSVVVIGEGEFGGVDDEIRDCVDIKGWMDFPEMFDEIERADFFLPLLDPLDPAHDRYVTIGTSGSFQLVYGFAKPCVINEKFAALHCFTDENSLIYKDNADLASSMKRAIAMSAADYDVMRGALEKTADDIYAESLETLKRIIANMRRRG